MHLSAATVCRGDTAIVEAAIMSSHDSSRPSFDTIVNELANDEQMLSGSEKALLASIVRHGRSVTPPAENAAFLRRLRQAVDGAIAERVMRLLASRVTEQAFSGNAVLEPSRPRPKETAISPMFPEPMFPGPLFPPDPFFHHAARTADTTQAGWHDPWVTGDPIGPVPSSGPIPAIPSPPPREPLFPPDPFFHHATGAADVKQEGWREPWVTGDPIGPVPSSGPIPAIPSPPPREPLFPPDPFFHHAETKPPSEPAAG
jgi:hypothetical protein